MLTTWKLQDAKAQFSKVVDDSKRFGPQMVTRRGKRAAVVISVKEFESLTSKKPLFSEFLLKCPKMDSGFEFERQKDFPREVNL